MTAEQAAARLGVAPAQVVKVREHQGGHVVELRSGKLMLVSPTTARAYLPEVDDAPASAASRRRSRS